MFKFKVIIIKAAKGANVLIVNEKDNKQPEKDKTNWFGVVEKVTKLLRIIN